ncbi:MAG: hypothetical protein ACI4HI_05095 [Lachnospiraceae bacterium]
MLSENTHMADKCFSTEKRWEEIVKNAQELAKKRQIFHALFLQSNVSKKKYLCYNRECVKKKEPI